MDERIDPWQRAEEEALQRLRIDNPGCNVSLGRHGEAIVTPLSRLTQPLADRAMVAYQLALENIV